MRITFIRPSMTAGVLGDALEPLAFGILAGLTPKEIEVRFHDERIESIDLDEPTDLVALSFDTYSARRAYEIALHFRRRDIPVVAGGYHPTLWTSEALQAVDAVAVGDAEDTWPVMLQDFRAGTLKKVYQSQFPSLAGLRIDRSVFAGKKYGPLRLVQFGRGCRHSCDFCSIHAFYGPRIRYRPVEETAREIEGLRTRGIVFTDDNLFADRDLAIDLLRTLKRLRIRWSCQANLDIAADEDVLRLMAESGCTSVTVGFESLCDGNLAQMRKAANQTSADYEALVGRFHSHGIMVYGSFVFGYDFDTLDGFARSLEFAMRLKLFLANFNPLIPMPGTPLYERLHREERLIYDPWWLDPQYRYGRATFHPQRMSAQALTDGCYWARSEFNRIGAIARRSLNRKANARSLYNYAAHWIANLINRREIHRKQGLPLGGQDILSIPIRDMFS